MTGNRGARSESHRDDHSDHALTIRDLSEVHDFGARHRLTIEVDALGDQEIRICFVECFNFAGRQKRIIFETNHHGCCSGQLVVETFNLESGKHALQKSVLHSVVLDSLCSESLAEGIVLFDSDALEIEQIDGGGVLERLDESVHGLLFFNYSFHGSS